jgi:RHS repeat-associated protein
MWSSGRFTTGAADTSDSIVAQVDRGYTGHEHLEELALIHMNGRLYDPTIARFTSADPFIQDPFSTLAFNRYAYVDNNPLTYIDPTGYLKWGKIIRNTVIRAVAFVVGTIACGGNAYCGAALAGAVGGYMDSHSLKGTLVGTASGLASQGIGQMLPVYDANGVLKPENLLPNASLHAARACATASAMGGRCGPSAAAAFVSSAAGPLTDKVFGSAGSALGGQVGSFAARVIGRGIAGGLASKMANGKFDQGFAEGSFEAITNALSTEIVSAVYKPQASNNAPEVACGPACPALFAIPAALETAGTALGGLTIGAGIYAVLDKLSVGTIHMNEAPSLPDFDFNDPSRPPMNPDGTPWEWRGPDQPGGARGGYVNPADKGQSAHPDLSHGGKIGPHWDFTDRGKGGWRVFPDGRTEPK